MRTKILSAGSALISWFGLVVVIVGVILIILTTITGIYFVIEYVFSFTETQYSECIIVGTNTTYILSDTSTKVLQYYEGALHFHHNEKDITLTNYAMTCKPL